MSGIEEELRARISAYLALSTGLRLESKKDFWDGEESHPLLKPEEAPAALIGWQAIEAYWAGSKGIMSDLTSLPRDIAVMALNPDLAVASFTQFWTATLSGGGILGGRSLAADVRVTQFWRRRAGQWLLFASVEGHLDPLLFARAMVRKASS